MMFNEVINTLNQERNVAFVPVSDCVYEGLVKIHEEDLRLQIDLGQGFPTKFPIISIPEDQHFRAHVQVGEKICLFNEESILIKPDMACQMLLDRGVYVNPVISPATPVGQSLLRTSYTATHTKEQMEYCAKQIKEVLDILPFEDKELEARVKNQ